MDRIFEGNGLGKGKYAQQNCRNMHNKLLKKCTIHIANSRKICYSRKEGESNEVN